MTLHQKTTASLIVTFICLSTALYWVSHRLIEDNYASIERVRARENIQRVQDALHQRLLRLSTAAQAWGQWDDTYQFAAGQNSDSYRRTNLTSAALVPMESDLIAVIRSSGQILDLTGYDIEKKRRIASSPHARKMLAVHNPILQSAFRGKVGEGLIANGQPMMLVAWPIVRTDGSGPPLGAFVLGRYIDRKEVSQLSNIIHLPLLISNWNDPHLPADFSKAKTSLTQVASFMAPLSQQVMAGYARLNDIYNHPAVIVRVDDPRDLYQQAQLSLRNLLLSLVAMGAVFCLVAVLLMQHVVLHRISFLASDLDKVSLVENLQGRVRVSGRDELSLLAERINLTLQTLQNTQQQLLDREQQFKHIVSNVPGLVYRISQRPDGTLTVPFVGEGIQDMFNAIDFLWRLRIIFKQLGKADNGIEWRSQFVTHARQKFTFSTVSVFCFNPGLFQLGNGFTQSCHHHLAFYNFTLQLPIGLRQFGRAFNNTLF